MSDTTSAQERLLVYSLLAYQLRTNDRKRYSLQYLCSKYFSKPSRNIYSPWLREKSCRVIHLKKKNRLWKRIAYIFYLPNCTDVQRRKE